MNICYDVLPMYGTVLRMGAGLLGPPGREPQSRITPPCRNQATHTLVCKHVPPISKCQTLMPEMLMTAFCVWSHLIFGVFIANVTRDEQIRNLGDCWYMTRFLFYYTCYLNAKKYRSVSFPAMYKNIFLKKQTATCACSIMELPPEASASRLWINNGALHLNIQWFLNVIHPLAVTCWLCVIKALQGHRD